MQKNFGKHAMTIANVLDMRKAENIVLLDVEEVTVIAETFIICNGTSDKHVQTLADEVENALAKEGLMKLREEGYRQGRWIVLDFGEILVHIFHKHEREFYDIERLWQTEDNFMTYPQ